jgi:hypothetical protein
MASPVRLPLLLIAAITFTLVATGPRPALPQAFPPTFDTVPDILLGQRLLLQVDDLVVSARDSNSNRLLDLAATANLAITTQFQRSNSIPHSNLPLTVAGRPFSTPSDTVLDIVLCPSDCVGGPFIIFIEYTVEFSSSTIFQAETILTASDLPPGETGQMLGAATADFNGDGYDELVLWYQTGSSQYMQVLTASDVRSPGDGLVQVGAWTPVAFTAQAGVLPGLVAADFNGDGVPEISRVANSAQELSVVFDTVSSSSLAITAGQLQGVGIGLPDLPHPPGGADNLVAAAAGQFDGNPADAELMVLVGKKPPAMAVLLDVSATLAPTVQATVDLPSVTGDAAGNVAYPLRIASGRLAAACGGATPCPDQAVVLYLPNAFPGPSVGTAYFTVAIVAFDPQALTLSVPASILFDDRTGPLRCAYDVAVGRFAPDPTGSSSAPVYDFDLQVAVLGQTSQNCVQKDEPAAVAIFDVTSARGFAFQAASTTTLNFSFGTQSNTNPLGVLVAADLQGRGMRLGPPEKVTIGSHTQPDIVLGLPPMHVDYIAPLEPFPGCASASEPCELNLTVYPSLPPSASSAAFNTAVSFSTTTQQTATRQSTTSYTFAEKTSATEKLVYGSPMASNVTVQATQALRSTHDTRVSSTFTGYAKSTSTVQSTTGFADHVFFTTYDLNVYYYPVIGQSVCPAGATCPPASPVPLYVAFSGPDSVQPSDADATTQEWYQPAHEPGNVLSYPCDLPSIFALLPGLIPLSASPAPWQEIDVSTTAYGASWAGGTSQGQTSGTTNSHSTDWSVSVSGQASLGFISGSASASFEEASSTSVSTVNTSTQGLDASTGMIVTRPAFPQQVADDFFYWFGGYVMGVSPPLATLQTLTPTDEQGDPVSIASTGPLVVGFVANPARPQAAQAPWWPQAYSQPDVALNHPARWDWTKSTQTVSFNAPTSAPPMEQDFYRMKGFYIVAGDVPALPDGSFQGPALSQATAGDALRLVARVYNYSLAPMPAGTTLTVRFYLQQVSGGATIASAILINEVTGVPAIPPFPGSSCSSDPDSPSPPNWVNVSTPFNTTGLTPEDSPTQWIFWVVVWMEDQNGNLVAELPGHGLTASPASLSFTDASQVPVEPYSNNVGLYGSYSPFVINPPGQGTTPSAIERGDLAIAAMTVGGQAASGMSIRLDRKVAVAVDLVAPRGDVGSHLVAFYDGVPGQGGRAFDVLRVAGVSTGTPYRARTYFRPETCGPRTLVAVAAPERAAAAVSQHVTVNVTADAVEAIEALVASTARLDLPTGTARRLLTPLEAARTAFQNGRTAEAGQHLLAFERAVAGLGGKVTAAQVDVLLAQSRLFRSCLVDGQLAATVTALSGSATRVGDGTDSAQVKLAGRFTLSPANGTLDLAIARVTILALLAETDGVGELVDRVAAGPVQLVARKGSKPGAATYESQPTTDRPGFRMDVKQRPGGVVEFDLKVDRAVLSRDPTLCSAGKPSTTPLVTRFTIADDLHPALAVATTRAWECVGRQPRTPSELKLR